METRQATITLGLMDVGVVASHPVDGLYNTYLLSMDNNAVADNETSETS